MTTPPRPSPGRPAAIDPGRIARVAVELFAERGYDAVSMEDIAQALGISRRSLFRYFATKADLVWDGVEPATDELRARFAAAPDASVFDAFCSAFVGGIGSGAIDLQMTRTRLRIISSHPDLLGLAAPRLAANSAVIREFLGARMPSLAGTVALPAIADALGAATFAALRYWATVTTDDAPDESLRRALGAVSVLRDLGR